VQRYYVATAREIRRLDSVSRSPIYAHFSETLAGAATIRCVGQCDGHRASTALTVCEVAARAYGQEERFVRENEQRLDANQRAYYVSVAANRWYVHAHATRALPRTAIMQLAACVDP
jgi:ATP-binding cassette, subfamily C (CFTR/MRP), member 1